MTDEKTIYVYMDGQKPDYIGKLYVEMLRGDEIFSFEYSEDWLKTGAACSALDPELYLYTGRQYSSQNKTMFGVFTDSCPDRWGRKLLNRRENLRAKAEGRKAKTLFENDYLLGVCDTTRMGALRYKTEKNDPFLAEENILDVPPIVKLRELQQASLALELADSADEEKWLKMLIMPGSSLGGARPKANVIDPDGNLWIAKFPSKNDDRNVGAWEKTAYDLAKMCGLNTAECKLDDFSDGSKHTDGSTFLVKRFDRNGNTRIHFASAMTMLGKTDGDKASYLDLAGFVKSFGGNPQNDLEELWRRIVFNMTISNTDDHLRNHGFIIQNNKWQLSPMYDINPCPDSEYLSLYIDDSNSEISKDLVISVSEYFGISRNTAEKYFNNLIHTILDNWKTAAKRNGISNKQIEEMEPAFSRMK